MKTQYYKLILLFLICLWVKNDVYGQIPRSTYFIDKSHSRISLNPALRPESSYIGVPFLSGIGVNMQTNTINLDNFTFSVAGNKRATFMHSDVTTEQFLSNLSNDNYISTDIGYNIFSMGFYKGEAFWNIDFGVKANIDVNLPKSMFRLVKQGFEQNEPTSYDVGGLSAVGNSYLELGVSYSRPFLNNSLMLGLKTKLLGGIANMDLEVERLNILTDDNKWEASSKVRLNASAPGIKPKYDLKDNGLEMIDGFDTSNWGRLSGFGLGFDLGAVYDFKNVAGTLDGFSSDFLSNLVVSTSLTDIGFISWSKGNSTHLESTGETVTVYPDYTIHKDGSTSIEDIFDDMIDDFEQAINLKEQKAKGRTTGLRMTWNLGMEYNILQDKLSAGLLYSNRLGNYFNRQELTLSGNYKPLSWLATSLTYSFVHSNFDTFGWALYLSPRKGINFFVVSDYIIPNVSPEWIPTTTKAINVQFGFTIPM